MIRGALVGLIHERSLTIKDGVYDDSLAVTLMSTDVDSVAVLAEKFNDFWSQVLEVFIGTYLLARRIGWICLVPLFLVVGKSVLVEPVPP